MEVVVALRDEFPNLVDEQTDADAGQGAAHPVHPAIGEDQGKQRSDEEQQSAPQDMGNVQLSAAQLWIPRQLQEQSSECDGRRKAEQCQKEVEIGAFSLHGPTDPAHHTLHTISSLSSPRLTQIPTRSPHNPTSAINRKRSRA